MTLSLKFRSRNGIDCDIVFQADYCRDCLDAIADRTPIAAQGPGGMTFAKKPGDLHREIIKEIIENGEYLG